MTLKLEGVYTALITPFKGESAEVDYEKLEEIVEQQIAAGVDGIVPMGTTGESPTLSTEEKNKVIEVCIKKAAKRCTVIAGTGSNNTAGSVAATQKAKDLGADAVLIVNPYYNKPSQEGLYQHVSKIAAVGIPIILYNIPGRSSILMEPATVARIYKDNEMVVAIKEATGSLDIASEIRSLCDITILSGDDTLTLPLISIGGSGVISVLSNFKPERVQAIVKPALAGDFKAAAKALSENFRLLKSMFIETNPVPVKAAMAMAGIIEPTVRLPLAPLTDASHDKLAATLVDYGILAAENVAKRQKTS